MKSLDFQRVEALLQEMIAQQKESLLVCGQRVIPNLTTDDMLQPNDYQELEENPHFRYQEGILAGLQSAQISLLALYREE